MKIAIPFQLGVFVLYGMVSGAAIVGYADERAADARDRAEMRMLLSMPIEQLSNLPI